MSSPEDPDRLFPVNPVYFSVANGSKRPGLEADHLSPFSSKVKNERNYAFIPLYSFVAYALATLTSPFQLPRLNLLFAHEFRAVFYVRNGLLCRP